MNIITIGMLFVLSGCAVTLASATPVFDGDQFNDDCHAQVVSVLVFEKIECLDLVDIAGVQEVVMKDARDLLRLDGSWSRSVGVPYFVTDTLVGEYDWSEIRGE